MMNISFIKRFVKILANFSEPRSNLSEHNFKYFTIELTLKISVQNIDLLLQCTTGFVQTGYGQKFKVIFRNFSNMQ